MYHMSQEPSCVCVCLRVLRFVMCVVDFTRNQKEHRPFLESPILTLIRTNQITQIDLGVKRFSQ